MELKEVIKKYRKQAHLTQTELGEKLGVGLSTVARYESGDITPPMEKISQMIDLFGNDFWRESIGMEMYFPYEASFNYQLLKELSLIYSGFEDDCDLIVTQGLKKFVVSQKDVHEFCNRCKEYLEISFKHFLLDKGVYQGQYNDDDGDNVEV